jgi:hypothetical protein
MNSRKLPDTKAFLSLSQQFLQHGTKQSCGERDPILVMIPFFTLAGFEEAYDAYILDHDVGVGFFNEQSSDFNSLFKQITKLPYGAKHTEATAQLCVLVTALSIVKKFKTPEQETKFVRTRALALQNLLSATEIGDGLSFINVRSRSLNRTSEAFSMFPKLKTTIYKYLLGLKTSFGRHIRPLLSESQLTTFNFIYDFTMGPRKTMAHVHEELIPELNAWSEVYSNLEKLYGDDWVYANLLEPTNTKTASKSWPKLASYVLKCQICVRKPTKANEVFRNLDCANLFAPISPDNDREPEKTLADLLNINIDQILIENQEICEQMDKDLCDALKNIPQKSDYFRFLDENPDLWQEVWEEAVAELNDAFSDIL